MLTGKRVRRSFSRSFSEVKNKRVWKPSCQWKKLWWDREKKWVRLFVSMKAMRKVDNFGLEEMANQAGLDLYAWCRPHWEPGSRQPLRLRSSWGNRHKKEKKYWPDYLPYLNKGKALSDIMNVPLEFQKKRSHTGHLLKPAPFGPWKENKGKRATPGKYVPKELPEDSFMKKMGNSE